MIGSSRFLAGTCPFPYMGPPVAPLPLPVFCPSSTASHQSSLHLEAAVDAGGSIILSARGVICNLAVVLIELNFKPNFMSETMVCASLSLTPSAPQAYIRVGGKHVHLGCHDGEVAAAQAFDQAAMLRHAHQLAPQNGSAASPLVTNFTPAFYQVRVVTFRLSGS